MSRIRIPKLQVVEPVGRAVGPTALVGQVARVRSRILALAWSVPAPPSTAAGRASSSSRSGIYILLALGLNIVVGLTGLLDLGYVAFFAVGAYTTAKLTTDGGSFTAWEALLARHRRRPWSPGVVLGGADPAPARRLPGHRHPRLRRDRAHRRPRTARASARRGASPASPTRRRIGNTEFGTKPLPYYYLVLVAIVIVILLVARA